MTILGTTVAVMLTTGDLAPAARDMNGEALRQWIVGNGVDAVDMAYVLGVTYARATVAPDDGDDSPLSGEYADDPTPRDVREVVGTLYRWDMADDAWQDWESSDDAADLADAFESGYCDERDGQWADAPTMGHVLDTIHSTRG